MILQGNRNRSRVLSMAVAFLMILTALSSFSVFADTQLSNKEILDLKAFGILHGDENGELNLESPITRAEFSKLVITMTQYEEAAGSISGGTSFPDVRQEHWAYGYINMLASLGLINGMPDGNFYPEQQITYYEAMKILVSSLGYYSIAEEKGGYPLGYVVTGGQIGVTNGVMAEGDASLLRGEAFRLIYNCLDAPRLEWVSTDANGNDILQQSTSTLRDQLMGSKRNGLAEIRAVVTATYDTWIYNPVPGMEKWQVEADGTLFNKGTTNAEEYLGQEVDMFIRADGLGGQYTIEQIMPTKNNTVLTLDRTAVEGLEETSLRYTNENDKETQRSIAEDASFLYNGRMVEFKDLEFEKIKNGTLKFISNDGDTTFDIVLVESYESYEVESVDTKNLQFVLTAEKKFDGQRRISVDNEANNTNIQLMDTEGAEMALEEMEKGNVISIFASHDKELIRIFCSDRTMEGKVTGVWAAKENPEIAIDDERLFVEDGVDLTELAGSEITAKINFEGRLFGYERGVGAKKYAAIIGVAEDAEFGTHASVRMVLPGALSEEEEEQEDTGNPQQDEIPALSAKNSNIAVFDFASKVRFGESVIGTDPVTGAQVVTLAPRTYAGSEMKERIEAEMLATGKNFVIVSYKLNKDGQINFLDFPEAVGSSVLTSRTYNAYEKTFGNAKIGGAFGVTDKTLSICMPSNTISSQEDYLAKVKMTNNQSYDVAGYDYNDGTYCPDLIVISAPMRYTSSGNIIATSKIAVVSSRETFVDEAGEISERVTLMTQEGEKTYPISDHSNSGEDLYALRPGDVIYYSLDGLEYLDGYKLLSTCAQPLPAKEETTVATEAGSTLVFVGTALDVNYNVVSNVSNRWVDEVICETDSGVKRSFEVRMESTPPIYLYNSRTNTVELGDRMDLLAPHERIIVCATGATRQVKAIVMNI